MTHVTRSTRWTALFATLSLAALGLTIAQTTQAQSTPTTNYGSCIITGVRGSTKLRPAVPGRLTVQTTLPGPGWFNGDTPNTIKDGFEFCMAANIAHRAGLNRVVVRNTPFDALVAGRSTGFDIGLVQVTITEARGKVVDFTVPYFSSDQGVLARKDANVTNANLASKRIGVPSGTTTFAFINSQIKPTSQVRVYPDSATMLTALRANQIDVAMLDTVVLLGRVKEQAGQAEVVGQFRTGENYGGVLPKGSVNRANVDKIITEMEKDGTLKKLSEAYLSPVYGGDPAAVPYWTVAPR